MSDDIDISDDIEDLDAFRQRARRFVAANLRPVEPGTRARSLRPDRTDEEELALVAREREIQRLLFDEGLAGLCFPRVRRAGPHPGPPTGTQRGAARFRVPRAPAGAVDLAVRHRDPRVR